MKKFDPKLKKELGESLSKYERSFGELAGLGSQSRKDVFICQMIESLRRVQFLRFLASERADPVRADPSSEAFDPIRASSFHRQSGDIEEAIWLAFLAIHFGKNLKTRWQLCREVYGGLGTRQWNWQEVSTHFYDFETWLRQMNQKGIKHKFGGRFGNHRKYESMRSDSSRGLPNVVGSYLDLIDVHGSQHELFCTAPDQSNSSQEERFDHLYSVTRAIISFGRTARFDFLTLLQNLQLADINPGQAYLTGATGPAAGSRLLFHGSRSAKIPPAQLESELSDLDGHLQVGMQVLEDSICNWQKSPSHFRFFRG